MTESDILPNIFYSIMELENARDDLMFVVHKYPSDKQDYDINVKNCK